MSLPLFLTRNHGTLFLVKTSVRVGLQKVVENQDPVSQFVPASWASVRNRLCIRQVDAWVCLYVLGLIQESGMQTKHFSIWVCLFPSDVIQEGAMQASTPTSELVFVS